MISIISSFVLRCNQLELTSQTFFPKYNQCPGVRLKCGTEEVGHAYKTNPHAWTGFPDYQSSGFTAGSNYVKVASESTLKNHAALQLHVRQNMTSWYMRGKSSAISQWIPVKDQLFPWAQRLALVKSVLNLFGHNLGITMWGWACNSGQRLFWSFNRSGRSLIQFVANSASSLQDPRKSLVCCQHCGARIKIKFDLEMQSPRTERTCHSVGTTRSREAGTNSSGCDSSPKLWTNPLRLRAPQEGPSATVLLLKVLYLLQPAILPDSGPRITKCLPQRIWYSAIAKHRQHWCHTTFCWLVY